MLFEATYNWFSYLRMVALEGKNVRVTVPEMKSRLIALMEEMERKVESDSEVRQGFQRIRYALTVFADEVLITSEWDYAGDWFEERLEKHFYQSTVGGDRFFDDLRDAREKLSGPEVIGVYFLCLSLGFKGKYFSQVDSLRSLHRELYSSLPQRITTRMDDLFPEAYVTDTRKSAQRPVAALGKVLFTMALSFVAFLLLSLLIWSLVKIS
jgi:type VI secretion system protein ImpK